MRGEEVVRPLVTVSAGSMTARHGHGHVLSTQLSQSIREMDRAIAVIDSQPAGKLAAGAIEPGEYRSLSRRRILTNAGASAGRYIAMNAPVALTSQLPCQAPGPIQPSTNERVQHRLPRQD